MAFSPRMAVAAATAAAAVVVALHPLRGRHVHDESSPTPSLLATGVLHDNPRLLGRRRDRPRRLLLVPFLKRLLWEELPERGHGLCLDHGGGRGL